MRDRINDWWQGVIFDYHGWQWAVVQLLLMAISFAIAIAYIVYLVFVVIYLIG